MRPRRRRVPDGGVVIATMKPAWHHPNGVQRRQEVDSPGFDSHTFGIGPDVQRIAANGPGVIQSRPPSFLNPGNG